MSYILLLGAVGGLLRGVLGIWKYGTRKAKIGIVGVILFALIGGAGGSVLWLLSGNESLPALTFGMAGYVLADIIGGGFYWVIRRLRDE